MESYQLLNIGAYTMTARRGFGGCTYQPSVLTSHDPYTAKRLLRKFMPCASKADHVNYAIAHAEARATADAFWSGLVDIEFKVIFGRDFHASDYKISGIAREEFSDVVKNRLREFSGASSKHGSLCIYHLMASGLSLEFARKRAKELTKNIVPNYAKN